MDEQQIIIQTLPPILTSIGGFFVLLFFGYSDELKEKRFLFGALFVLLVWIAYVGTILAGENVTLFSPFITLSFLVMALVCLSVLFYLSTRGKKFSVSLGLVLFSIGSAFSTIGFVNYFGMQGRVVVAVNKSFCSDEIGLSWIQGATEHSIVYINFLSQSGVVFDGERLRKVNFINVKCGNDENKITLEDFQKNSRGLGVEFVHSKVATGGPNGD